MIAPIPKREVGTTGCFISELGFGAASLGNLYTAITDEEARDAVDSAVHAGITYFDTAPYYGFGLSERRLGDALRGRTEMVLSSKVGRLLLPDATVRDDSERHGFRSPMPFRPVFDYRHDAILRSFEASLQRLGLEKIDLLLVHDIGGFTHGEQAEFYSKQLVQEGGLEALERLKSEGTIGGYGIGVNEVEAATQVMDRAAIDVILLAGRYTLLEQSALSEILPRCEQTQTSVIVGGPYNSGILATGTRGIGPFYYNYAEAPPEVVGRVRRLEAVCGRHGVPLAAAALQFPLAHPAVAGVIPGLGSASRVNETLNLYRYPIPDDFWDELRREQLIRPDAPAAATAQ